MTEVLEKELVIEKPVEVEYSPLVEGDVDLAINGLEEKFPRYSARRLINPTYLIIGALSVMALASFSPNGFYLSLITALNILFFATMSYKNFAFIKGWVQPHHRIPSRNISPFIQS